MKTACVVVIVSAVAMAACGGSAPASQTASTTPAAKTAVPSAPAAQAVATVPKPADGCGWVPAADVERIIGPLAGPPVAIVAGGPVKPRPGGAGCFYQVATHPDPERLAKAAKFQEAIKKMPGYTGDPFAEQAKQREAEGEIDLDKRPGVAVSITPASDYIGQWAMGAAMKKMAPEIVGDAKLETPKPNADGWDNQSRLAGIRMYQRGHVSIDLTATQGMPAEKLGELAKFIRDRIPELPFASTRTGGTPRNPDPCSVLTRTEAESKLGPLVVPPFRSQDEKPLYEAAGSSCTYQTAGQRVLVLTPEFSDGKSSFQMSKGLGKLISMVGGQDRTVLVGSWDDAMVQPGNVLMFVKGDRALTVHYMTAGIDQDAALELVEKAMVHLSR